MTTVDAEQLRRDFPYAAAAGPYFAEGEFETTLEMGLEILLDEMEREVAGKRGGALSAEAQKA